jgi:hypothetical protein
LVCVGHACLLRHNRDRIRVHASMIYGFDLITTNGRSQVSRVDCLGCPVLFYLSDHALLNLSTDGHAEKGEIKTNCGASSRREGDDT